MSKFCAPMEYLIPVLIKQKKALEIKSDMANEESAIKFSPAENIAVIEEVADKSIVQLELVISYMEKYENKLIEIIKSLITKIRQILPISKESSLNYLKRKKLLEKTLVRHQQTIHNLEDILLTLEGSFQQDIIKVTQAATIALRTLNHQTTSEDIEKTIEEYRHEENISKEIQKFMENIQVNKEDEKELEEELEMLMDTEEIGGRDEEKELPKKENFVQKLYQNPETPKIISENYNKKQRIMEIE